MSLTPISYNPAWQVIPIEDDDREILIRTLKSDSFNESANAGVKIANVATKHGLENNVSYSVYFDRIDLILHGQDKGPVTDNYHLLAKELDLELGIE